MLEEEYNPRRQLPPHLRRVPPETAAFSFEIRDAQPGDIPDMREIYNHYVANTTVTFDEDALTLAEMRKKYKIVADLKYPWLVAVSPGCIVLGYAFVTPWKTKAAYRFTVENSIYLGPASTGKGLGTALMKELMTRSKAAGIKEIVAVIADKGADPSLRLHERFGFKEIGHMGKVGFKFGRWLGTYLLQKSLK
ncbi:MAG: N-acetyltransferase family protein [Pseudolysinimonas sp.]